MICLPLQHAWRRTFTVHKHLRYPGEQSKQNHVRRRSQKFDFVAGAMDLWTLILKMARSWDFYFPLTPSQCVLLNLSLLVRRTLRKTRKNHRPTLELINSYSNIDTWTAEPRASETNTPSIFEIPILLPIMPNSKTEENASHNGCIFQTYITMPLWYLRFIHFRFPEKRHDAPNQKK